MNSTLMTKSLASHIPRELKLSPNAKPLSPGFFSHQQLTACGCGIHVFGNSVTLDCMFPPPAHEHGIKTYNIISFMIVTFCVVFFLDSFFFTWQLVQRETMPLGRKSTVIFFYHCYKFSRLLIQSLYFQLCHASLTSPNSTIL